MDSGQEGEPNHEVPHLNTAPQKANLNLSQINILAVSKEERCEYADLDEDELFGCADQPNDCRVEIGEVRSIFDRVVS